MERKRQYLQIFLTAFLSLCITGCGKQENLNSETGEKKPIPLNSDDYYIGIEGYRDGWIYYEKCKKMITLFLDCVRFL